MGHIMQGWQEIQVLALPTCPKLPERAASFKVFKGYGNRHSEIANDNMVAFLKLQVYASGSQLRAR